MSCHRNQNHLTGFYPSPTADGRPGVLARGRVDGVLCAQSPGCLSAMTAVASFGMAGLRRAGTMPSLPPSSLSCVYLHHFRHSISSDLESRLLLCQKPGREGFSAILLPSDRGAILWILSLIDSESVFLSANKT